MKNSGKTKAHLHQIKRYILILMVIWTLVIAASLVWNIFEVKRNTLEEVRIQARVAYDKDIIYRRWNAMHGGVYVPATSESPPNPYLTFVEERDITTSSGKKLTLMNPAYMTRQVHELMGGKSGVQGHITSLKPIRPENAADLWETEALQAFERGEAEISSIEWIEDKEYMRLMRPLITEKSCLKCHAKQGYVEGDIRGGISVSVPMEPLRAVARLHMLMLALGHIFLWMVGLGGIILGTQRLIRSEVERKKAEEILKESEDRYAKAERIGQFGHWDWNFVEDKTVWSKEAYRLFGVDPNQFMPLYRDFLNIIHPTDKERFDEAVQATVSNGAPFDIEYRINPTNGKVRVIHSVGEIRFDQEGQALRLVGTIHDITERKKAEEAVRESEKRYRTLFDSSLDGVYQTDADGVFVKLNQAIVKMLGHRSPKELIGRNALDYWADPKDREIFRAELKREKSLSSYPILAKRINGEEFYLENTCRIMEDSKGNFIGIEGILREVTERKKADEALKKYSDNLEQSNHLKDLFIDIMCHDLLNPAGVAKNMCTLLLNSEEDPQKREILELTLETNDRVINMIENASILATLESGEDLKVEEMDLCAVLKSAAKEMIPLADEKKVKIKISINGDEFKASVNPLIHDAFSNLINNAIKYGPEDSEVVVGIKGNGSKWKVSITDNGPGIPDEYKETVFTRFKRIKKEGVKGTGLGLTIVKKVVEAHEGRVWVEDNPGGGSIFYVALPKI